VNKLTRYGDSDLEEDGALAGDFMVRGLTNQLSQLISNDVPGSKMGTLFSIGISFTDDGKLEISAVDEFGFGSGEDRLKDALDDSFDDVANLFTDPDNGIAKNLYDYVNEFTRLGGLLKSREDSFKSEKESLETERERFELQMLSFEQIQRNKYIDLDQTVSQLNRTGNALLASLG
jgi:flagellar hook-associated protein 2